MKRILVVCSLTASFLSFGCSVHPKPTTGKARVIISLTFEPIKDTVSCNLDDYGRKVILDYAKSKAKSATIVMNNQGNTNQLPDYQKELDIETEKAIAETMFVEKGVYDVKVFDGGWGNSNGLINRYFCDFNEVISITSDTSIKAILVQKNSLPVIIKMKTGDQDTVSGFLSKDIYMNDLVLSNLFSRPEVVSNLFTKMEIFVKTEVITFTVGNILYCGIFDITKINNEVVEMPAQKIAKF